MDCGSFTDSSAWQWAATFSGNAFRASRPPTTRQIDGTIYPLSPRVAGHVIQANVRDQATVKANDVLVQLDPSDFEVALAKARAELADAEATLASARSDIPVTSVSTASVLSGARSSRQDAAAQVSGAEQALGAAKARLKTAEANVRVAEANAHKAAQDVERYKALIARDDIPRQQYEQAVADAEAGRASVDAQKAAVTEAQQNVLAAEKNVEQARATRGPGRCHRRRRHERAAASEILGSARPVRRR